MSLTKSKGNMYDWVTHTHSHLLGKCSHECGYCYVQAMANRFPVMAEKYSGDIEIDLKELKVNYGKGNLIFIEHMNDLFAEGVPEETIKMILKHCMAYPENKYVFQSKNPARMRDLVIHTPGNCVMGTTIESNRHHDVMGAAPSVFSRIIGIQQVSDYRECFITIEPVLDFDLDAFAEMLIWADPDFINIGADSKGHGLAEPSYEKIMALYELLVGAGIEVRKKINLNRLKEHRHEK